MRLRQRPDASWYREGTTDSVAHDESIRDYSTLVRALAEHDASNFRAILDAGANEGTSTRIFAEAYPRATIVSLEVSNETLAMARLNTAMYANVVLRPVALWDEDTSVRFHPSIYGEWANNVRPMAASAESRGHSPSPLESEIPVAAMTVPALLRDHRQDAFDFMKIDIEKAEMRLLNGSRLEWLARTRYLFLEGHLPGQKRLPERSKLTFLATLLASGLCMFTMPEYHRMGALDAHEYVYFGCNKAVPHAQCARICRSWQAYRAQLVAKLDAAPPRTPFECELVTDAHDFTGVMARAQRMGVGVQVSWKNFTRSFRSW